MIHWVVCVLRTLGGCLKGLGRGRFPTVRYERALTEAPTSFLLQTNMVSSRLDIDGVNKILAKLIGRRSFVKSGRFDESFVNFVSSKTWFLSEHHESPSFERSRCYLPEQIGLVWSNPTMDDYLRFVEQELSKAIDRMDQGTPTREQQFIRQVFQSQSRKLLESLVRPNTVRHNWGIVSQYETQVADTNVIVSSVSAVDLFPFRVSKRQR